LKEEAPTAAKGFQTYILNAAQPVVSEKIKMIIYCFSDFFYILAVPQSNK